MYVVVDVGVGVDVDVDTGTGTHIDRGLRAAGGLHSKEAFVFAEKARRAGRGVSCKWPFHSLPTYLVFRVISSEQHTC